MSDIDPHSGFIAAGSGADAATAVSYLRTPLAIRVRAANVRRYVADGRSAHFTLDESRLPVVADYVAAVTRDAYPSLDVPPHSRWRHFSAGGIKRWDLLVDAASGGTSAAEALIDLVMVSVLLDAGAGDRWRYKEPATGLEIGRSEGLAVASIAMFAAGEFSSDPSRPFMADATALKAIGTEKLARGFQAGADNPLIGLDRRAALLRGLGQALEARPDLFGKPGRPGHLADHFLRTARDHRVAAPELLRALLESLSSIWPSGLVVDGVSVGDAGRHPAIRTGDATDRIVPFHKLSQWLTYSLIEPLQWAGLAVTDLDDLTALPEYRNGGLLIDLDVIRPRSPIVVPQEVSSELVVEWRALTVALIDELLVFVRQRLGLNATFALPHLLQGGTWSAGRKIARELRPPDGPSPVPLSTDGTVF